jgi:hypothetical protein
MFLEDGMSAVLPLIGFAFAAEILYQQRFLQEKELTFLHLVF